MYLSFFDEKPFYHELDFKSHYIEKYLYSILEHRNNDQINNNNDIENYDLKSIYNLQNIIITGPRGSCKTTQIFAFIASLLNTRSIYNLKNNVEGFRYKYSPFHIQFSIKNFKNNDIIDDNQNIKFIRNIVSTPNMGFNIPKLLYISDFDKSSIEIQKFFLRIIEKSSSNVRFILEINNLNNLNPAIISRFFTLYCKIPSYDQVKKSLYNVYDKYIIQNHLNIIDNHIDHIQLLQNEKETVINQMILNSHLNNFTYKPVQIFYNLKDIFGNMAIYISSFKNPYMYKNIYTPIYIKKCIKLKNIIFNITQNTFFENMNIIRELLLELYVNNIDSSMVLKYLYSCAVEYYHNSFHILNDLTEKLSFIEYKMKISNKDVIFMEMYIVYILKHILFHKKEDQKIIHKEDQKIIYKEDQKIIYKEDQKIIHKEDQKIIHKEDQKIIHKEDQKIIHKEKQTSNKEEENIIYKEEEIKLKKEENIENIEVKKRGRKKKV